MYVVPLFLRSTITLLTQRDRYVQEALDAFRESAATHTSVKLKEHHI